MAEGSDHPQLIDPDALLDEIFARKGPQKYAGGLSEENWEEELEQIPLFMTRSPEAIDPEKSPALAALQDIKYEDQTPRSRASAHKEDGNEHFKGRRYKQAVLAYTAGIREKCEDTTLTAVLYTNRAAAQFYLGNYRSSLLDATQAQKVKPGHMKALVRGALACVQLERFEEALQWCDEGLRVEPDSVKLREVRIKAAREKKKQQRDQRKQSATEKVKEEEDRKLLAAIKSRGIHLADERGSGHHHDNSEDDNNEEGLTHQLSLLSLQGPHPSGEKVHLDTEGNLVWPVIFLYPEYGQTDFIAAFSEHHRFADHVAVMFSESAPWDTEKKYTPSTVEVWSGAPSPCLTASGTLEAVSLLESLRGEKLGEGLRSLLRHRPEMVDSVYYESRHSHELIRVPLDATLVEVLASQSYAVISGTPSFILLAAESPFREQFISRTA